MTRAEFYTKLNDAATRALGDGLSVEDCRLIRDAVRAWDRAGRPASGPLHDAESAAWRVFRFAQLHHAKQRRDEIGRLRDEIAAMDRDAAARITTTAA